MNRNQHERLKNEKIGQRFRIFLLFTPHFLQFYLPIAPFVKNFEELGI